MDRTPPTASAFKAAFPEFTGAPDALVTAKIADAVGRTGEVWGDLWLQGVQYRTADLLAKSPFGRGMRLVNKDGTTAYSDDLRTMVRRVAARSGTRVLTGVAVSPMGVRSSGLIGTQDE